MLIGRCALRGAALYALLAAAPAIGVLADPPPDAQAKGLAIAEEMERRDAGWGDQRAQMIMILRNRQGETSTLLLVRYGITSDAPKQLPNRYEFSLCSS